MSEEVKLVTGDFARVTAGPDVGRIGVITSTGYTSGIRLLAFAFAKLSADKLHTMVNGYHGPLTTYKQMEDLYGEPTEYGKYHVDALEQIRYCPYCGPTILEPDDEEQCKGCTQLDNDHADYFSGLP